MFDRIITHKLRFVKRFFIPFDFLSGILYNFIGLIYFNEKCGETMYKVGICGRFGYNSGSVNGQTDKTVAVYNAVAKAIGKENIALIDSYGWQKNPLKMIGNCRKLLSECENVIVMPARKGVKVFPALFNMFNRSYGRKLHYVVIGGWLNDELKASDSLKKQIKKLDCVYVELEQMKKDLQETGLDNVIYMPNFRSKTSIDDGELVYNISEPYRVCTFSRILREKGIEEAVDAVRKVNSHFGRTVYELDIFGMVEPEYKERFDEIQKSFEPYITYKGIIDNTNCSDELKNYFAMLFPTFYKGEGFAGTIIDAFSAGVPVIATDWHYNASIITHLVNGVIYDTQKPELLTKILVEAAKSPDMLNALKLNCLKAVAPYEADEVIKILLNELGVVPEREAETV